VLTTPAISFSSVIAGVIATGDEALFRIFFDPMMQANNYRR
jgi:hypothetical protein